MALSREEIATLFEQFAPVVHRRALLIVGRESDAWDIVQEVFEHMLKSSAEFRAEARPMTWVYRITTNAALNAVRSRGLREPEGNEADSPLAADLMRTVDARQMLAKLSSSLDQRELSIVALSAVDGLTQQQIADTLELSRKTINRELEQIRGKLLALGYEKFEVAS